MALIFYKIFLFIYAASIKIFAAFNKKARLWIDGRNQLLNRMATALAGNESPLIWIHCASLGEFEQGRPVLELLREQYKDHKILLTFFSPSGFEVQKNYKGADFVFYLPFDSTSNAEKFLNITKPALAIFVKYEYWYYILEKTYKKNIPILLISAVFTDSQPFFKWYGSLHRKMLGFFTHIFVQDQSSLIHLKKIKELPVTVAGDTRFDRVWEIAQKTSTIPYLNAFCNKQQVLIAGSTWPADEALLSQLFQQPVFSKIKLVIAPHEISEINLASIRSLLKDAVFYSDLKNDQEAAKAQILVIDNVGMLSRLYQYATVTYVGGGFSKDGIHNILEAAVWGKPVLFGPNHKKFKEAERLIAAGGGKSFSDLNQLNINMLEYFTNATANKKAAEAAQFFIQNNRGASLKVLDFIQENRLLTNL